jgi:hypothetical protein
VGGLPVAELNTLELEFLRLNDYSLFVDISKLQRYGDNVLEHWNQTQELESLSIRDNNVPAEDIVRPFSRLTMRTSNSNNNNTHYKSASNDSSSPTTPTTPTADNMDKQWRSYGSRQSFSLKSGNNETTTSKEALRRL